MYYFILFIGHSSLVDLHSPVLHLTGCNISHDGKIGH